MTRNSKLSYSAECRDLWNCKFGRRGQVMLASAIWPERSRCLTGGGCIRSRDAHVSFVSDTEAKLWAPYDNDPSFLIKKLPRNDSRVRACVRWRDLIKLAAPLSEWFCHFIKNSYPLNYAVTREGGWRWLGICWKVERREVGAQLVNNERLNYTASLQKFENKMRSRSIL